MVGPRHVRADRHVACPRRGPAHLRHRGVDSLAQDRIGLSRPPRRTHAVLRHGARSRRSGGADQRLACAARWRGRRRGGVRISRPLSTPLRPPSSRAGFPWPPHRGIETITYGLAGTVDHGDSLGNRGSLGAGDVQWMTAGSGILHQEMPQGDPRGRMHGFQLWANLPSRLKMTSPRYQDIPAAEIPDVGDDDGTRVRIICGEFWGKRGPVDGIAAEPRYLDVTVPPRRRKTLAVQTP